MVLFFDEIRIQRAHLPKPGDDLPEAVCDKIDLFHSVLIRQSQPERAVGDFVGKADGQQYMRPVSYTHLYVLTKTPALAKSDLYKMSEHWYHYKEGMFVLGDEEKDDEEKDDEVMALRPMTCPFQYMIYKAEHHSYRDLPIRYAETSPLFRNEASGEMHGLIRVRQFTLADGHLVVTPEQVEDEFKGVVDPVSYTHLSY